jgi:hypothetical protein
MTSLRKSRSASNVTAGSEVLIVVVMKSTIFWDTWRCMPENSTLHIIEDSRMTGAMPPAVCDNTGALIDSLTVNNKYINTQDSNPQFHNKGLQ